MEKLKQIKQVGDKLPALANSQRQALTDEQIDERERKYEKGRLADDKRSAWNSFIKKRGRRYRDCRFDNFESTDEQQRNIVAKLKKFCTCDKLKQSNLILLGPSGTGKDHLLVACVLEAIRAGVLSIEWTSGPELFSDLRQAIGNKGLSENAVVVPLINCELLVISDLAMTTLTDYQREIVYKIIDRRYNNMRATWVSANVADRSAFELATSPQIVDRLVDDATYIACNWESFRKTRGRKPSN